MNTKRTIALLMAVLMLLSLFSGCGADDDPAKQNDNKSDSSTSSEDNEITKPKFAWKADYLEITGPDGAQLSYINGFCMGQDKAYLAAQCVVGMETVTDPVTGEPILDENVMDIAKLN